MKHALPLILLAAAFIHSASAGEPKTKPSLASYFGKTPEIDGEMSPGEWADATPFSGVKNWAAQFSPVDSDNDLALKGWVKHDHEALYFAFDVTDDLLYGIDTQRWLPPENAKAHEISRDGFPWFGDELELLLNAPNTWNGEEDSEGTGASWQMVCNATKSTLGGIGKGGLLEGEPRSKESAWNTYRRWIREGSQRAAVRVKPGGKGYIVEWAVRFKPCVELKPGQFYNPVNGKAEVGLNIALGDLDTEAAGKGNFGLFHHEQWWSGEKDTRTHKNNFGTLRLMGRERKPSR